MATGGILLPFECERRAVRGGPAIPQRLKTGSNGSIEFSAPGSLIPELCSELRRLLFKRLDVAFLLFGADALASACGRA